MRRPSVACIACAIPCVVTLCGCSRYVHDEDYHEYHSGRYSSRGVYYDEGPDEYISHRKAWARSHYFDPEFQPWGRTDRPNSEYGYSDWGYKP